MGGKLTCPRCKNVFLPLSDEAEVCPHCGSEVGAHTGPAPAAGWYFTRGGVQAGRALAAELKRMAESGALLPTDFVRKADSDRWVEAGKVRGLFPEAPAPDPLPLPESKEQAPFDQPPPAPPDTSLPRSPPRARSYELLATTTAPRSP